MLDDDIVIRQSGPGCCFTAETMVAMADGSHKAIADICIGDEVIGTTGIINTVTGIETPVLGNRDLYAINDGEAFVTAEHPFLTTRGWRSIDPEASLKENPALIVNALQAGDVLITAHGEVVIESIVAKISGAELVEELAVANGLPITFGSQITVYNLLLDGDHTYYADDYVVHNKHNKGGGPDSDPYDGPSGDGKALIDDVKEAIKDMKNRKLEGCDVKEVSGACTGGSVDKGPRGR